MFEECTFFLLFFLNFFTPLLLLHSEGKNQKIMSINFLNFVNNCTDQQSIWQNKKVINWMLSCFTVVIILAIPNTHIWWCMMWMQYFEVFRVEEANWGNSVQDVIIMIALCRLIKLWGISEILTFWYQLESAKWLDKICISSRLDSVHIVQGSLLMWHLHMDIIDTCAIHMHLCINTAVAFDWTMGLKWLQSSIRFVWFLPPSYKEFF